MSDFGDDIDDELLELAGASEKKRKKRQRQASSSKPSAAKRRKAEVSSDSGDSPESEEEDDAESESVAMPLYPLDGQYIDEEDRERLLQLPEIERENILGERMEELQRIKDKRNLDQMLKAQKGGDDSVSKAAKRQHAVKGATKEKTRKLDELRAKRKAKDEKKRTKSSPNHRDRERDRDRSSSPMDMETDSDNEEDGQISKYEEEEERDRKRFGYGSSKDRDRYGEKDRVINEEPITLEDLLKVRLTREQLAKHCMAPWFEEFVRGAWVRYLIGQENGQPVYRICEIAGLGVDKVKPYKIDDKTTDQTFELKHGKSSKVFSMDKVSNSAMTQREFERLQKVCTAEKAPLPFKHEVEEKSRHLVKLSTQRMTEAELTAMLARKRTLNSGGRPTAQFATMERSRLNQARTLALRRQDTAEVELIDAQLAELPAIVVSARDKEDLSDMLTKVNERNRKANLEAVRNAEIQEAERKRRERKLAAAARASGTPQPQDPSARLRTVPKLFNSISRPGTPTANGTPLLKPEQSNTGATARSVSPLPPSALSGQAGSPDKSKTFAASVIHSIEVDLGDF